MSDTKSPSPAPSDASAPPEAPSPLDGCSRRTLIGAAALAAPALLAGRAAAQEAPAGAAAASSSPIAAATAMPRVHSFPLGGFRVVVVRDGTRTAGAPHETFGTNQSPEAVKALLTENFLPTDGFLNGYAPTLVDTGGEVVLFDTGLGEAGRAAGGGRLVEGLTAAGYPPERVSVVVLTHMHGDHIGGLMEAGAPAFPNARYVTGQVEFDFWRDPARVGTAAEAGHKGVLAKVVPLADKTSFVADGATVVPGITAMAAFGHSPGHMVYRVESDGKALMLTADTANHFVLSLQRPDWEVRFDMDKAAAAASRRKVFDMIATERLPFIGYHMPHPSVGYVEVHGDGYRFVPASYQFDL